MSQRLLDSIFLQNATELIEIQDFDFRSNSLSEKSITSARIPDFTFASIQRKFKVKIDHFLFVIQFIQWIQINIEK